MLPGKITSDLLLMPELLSAVKLAIVVSVLKQREGLEDCMHRKDLCSSVNINLGLKLTASVSHLICPP